MDFLRFLQGPLLGLVGFSLLVLVASSIIRKRLDNDDPARKTVGTIRNWLLVIAVACVAWFAFKAASVNVVPRSVIDRSITNEQADRLEQQAEEFRSKQAEEKKAEKNQAKPE